MKFLTSTTLSIHALSLLALSGFSHAGACDPNSDFFLDVQYFGEAAEGAPFCMAHWETGGMVESLDIYYDTGNEWIVGIAVGYTDGTSETTGQTSYSGSITTQSLSWDALNDPITEAYVQQGRYGLRIDSINFQTQSGKTLLAGKTKTLGTGDQVDVGNGLIFGTQGYSASGSVIYGFAFLFGASAITGIDVSNLVFDESIETLTEEQTGVETVSLDDGYYSNTGNDSINYLFGNAQGRVVSRSYSQSTSNSVGASIGVSFSVGIPLIEKTDISAEVSYGYESVRDTTTAYTTTQTATWQVSGTVLPSSAVHCSAVSESGTLTSIGYTSTVQVTFQNGKSLTYSEAGTFTGVSWTSAFTSCSDIPLSSVPITAQRKRMVRTSVSSSFGPVKTAAPGQTKPAQVEIPKPKKFGGVAIRAVMGETPAVTRRFTA